MRINSEMGKRPAVFFILPSMYHRRRVLAGLFRIKAPSCSDTPLSNMALVLLAAKSVHVFFENDIDLYPSQPHSQDDKAYNEKT